MAEDPTFLLSGIGLLERQVIEAALITTRPTSSPHERSEASSSLERWTAGSSAGGSVGSAGSAGPGGSDTIDTACWEAYINILRVSFAANHFTPPSPVSTPCASRQVSNCSSSASSSSGAERAGRAAVEPNIVERIAYVTSPEKQKLEQQQISHVNLEIQIQREANGATLLLITLLSNKIRREFVRLLKEHPLLARNVYEELICSLICLGNNYDNRDGVGGCNGSVGSHGIYNSSSGDVSALMGVCCSALAAVVVRLCQTRGSQQQQTCSSNGIFEMIQMCKTSIAANVGIMIDGTAADGIFSPTVALRILANIPTEIHSRTDLTSAEIDALFQMPVHNDSGSPCQSNAANSVASAALETIKIALPCYLGGESSEKRDALLCSTLRTLSKWSESCKAITLSMLAQPQQPSVNSATSNPSIGSMSLLSQLVALLSSHSQQKQWSTAKHAQNAIIHSSRSLNACIAKTNDYGTQSRQEAIASLLSSLRHPIEFIVLPLKVSETYQWEDATVALTHLASTLSIEEMDDIASCRLPGCADLIELLLKLQSHPLHNVAVPVLEVWLALQDVPTSDRHPTLTTPLYGRLVDVISNRVAYPPGFVSWVEELDVEEADFEEMRRLAADVLVGAYFLLRAGYLERLANGILVEEGNRDGCFVEGGSVGRVGSGYRWERVEAALFCICAVAREACARVKTVSNASNGGRDSPVAADGEATSSGLMQLASTLCSGGGAVTSWRHPLILSGISNFLGCYSTVWRISCPPQAMFELLSYLLSAMATPAAAEAAGKGIRLVLIATGPKLASAAASTGADPSSYNQISEALTHSMDSVIATGDAKVMANVAEGCARVIVQLRDAAQARAILAAVVSPSLKHAQSALDAIVSSSSSNEGSGIAAGQLDAACQALASCLVVLRELIRFCDEPSKGGAGEAHILSDVLSCAWPVLNDISSNPCCRSHDAVLTALLDVHSQLLNVVPILIAPHFNNLVTFVVRSYEETFCPSALDYVSAAVESFGSDSSTLATALGMDENGKELLFNQLLGHLCQQTFTYVTQTKHPNECPQLIKALFEMAQRFLIFCPGALCQCPEFSSLFALATACLTECKGEAESTRATLIFLTQLIGWKHIRLQTTTQAKLNQHAGLIDTLLVQHGENIIKSCIGGLSGGAPQILWPSFSECLFSIMLHVISGSPPGAEEPTSVLHAWLFSAMNQSLVGTSQHISPDTTNSVISILCSLAKEGGKSKPKAKMLLMDFGKICKGETTPDVLLAYSLVTC